MTTPDFSYSVFVEIKQPTSEIREGEPAVARRVHTTCEQLRTPNDWHGQESLPQKTAPPPESWKPQNLSSRERAQGVYSSDQMLTQRLYTLKTATPRDRGTTPRPAAAPRSALPRRPETETSECRGRGGSARRTLGGGRERGRGEQDTRPPRQPERLSPEPKRHTFPGRGFCPSSSVGHGQRSLGSDRDHCGRNAAGSCGRSYAAHPTPDGPERPGWRPQGRQETPKDPDRTRRNALRPTPFYFACVVARRDDVTRRQPSVPTAPPVAGDWYRAYPSADLPRPHPCFFTRPQTYKGFVCCSWFLLSHTGVAFCRRKEICQRFYTTYFSLFKYMFFSSFKWHRAFN